MHALPSASKCNKSRVGARSPAQVSRPRAATTGGGCYRTPVAHLRVRGAYTNTLPVDANRGSGRPEATWVNERLTEQGAREIGIDVTEIRRRNLIKEQEFPYPTPGGRTYDNGNPPLLFENLIQLADYQSLRAEQEKLRINGTFMGIGILVFSVLTAMPRYLSPKSIDKILFKVICLYIQNLDQDEEQIYGSHLYMAICVNHPLFGRFFVG